MNRTEVSATTFSFFTSFVGWFSYVFGNFIFQFVSSRGWTGRVDALIVLCLAWIMVASSLARFVALAAVIDARRPLWVRYVRDALEYLSVIYGFFVTFYITDLMQLLDFKSLTWPEMLLLLGGGILLMLSVKTATAIFITGRARLE